jgi:3-deoxy-D-manno-octulosonic-acid transferase
MQNLYSLLLRPLPAAAALLEGWWRLTGREERRREIRERRGYLPEPVPGSRPLWIQAASMGEVVLAGRLLRELESRIPGLPVALSCTTRTGRALAEEKALASLRFYFPLDSPSILARALDRLSPRLFVSIETELWPHLIRELGRRRVPAAVISGRLSPRSYGRYRKVRRAVAPMLSSLSVVGAGSEEEADRFRELGAPAERVVVTGNLKYDLEGEPLGEEERRRAVEELGLEPGHPLLVAGSTGEGEEALVLSAFERVAGRPEHPVLLLAPRHPERFEKVAALLEAGRLPWARRSVGRAGPGARILLVDTLGELAGLYGLALGAFVGGTLVPVGGHNLLEPAVRAVPLCFGPHLDNVTEMAEALLGASAARRVADAAALGETFAGWLESPGDAREEGARGRRFVESHRGATARSVELIRALLEGRGKGEEAPP